VEKKEKHFLSGELKAQKILNPCPARLLCINVSKCCLKRLERLKVEIYKC